MVGLKRVETLHSLKIFWFSWEFFFQGEADSMVLQLAPLFVSLIVEIENKLIVVAIEEKDTWTGNGRKGDLGCGEALL